MPARHTSSEPRTPPATPKRSRSRRNGSGSRSSQSSQELAFPNGSRGRRNGSGSHSSQSSQGSQGSQKYTAYLRERITPPSSFYSSPTLEEHPFLREEKIFERLQSESSQPSILYHQDDVNNPDDYDIINDDVANQFVPNLPIDRDIATVGNQNMRSTRALGVLGGLFKILFGFFTGLFAKLLNPIWVIILFFYSIIGNSINYTRNLTRNIIINNNNNNNNNSSSSSLLLFGLIFVLLFLILSNIRFNQGDKTFTDYFPSNSIYIWALDKETYKIQPIGEKKKDSVDKNDSIIITRDDFRQMIIAEVKNYMDSENGKHVQSSSNEPLRRMISEIISLEVKKGLSNARVPSRLRSSKGEETLEIIRREARSVVKDELLKYSQDKLNRPDFALHSGGAKVLKRFTSKTYELWPDKWYQRTFAYLSGTGITRGKPPVTAISHDTNVGQCWPFPGQAGQLAVFLSRRVYVTAVTYDHVSKGIAVDVLSAPKDFEVWGIIDDGTVGDKISTYDEEDYIEDYNPQMESTEESCGVRVDGRYEPTIGDSDNNGLGHLKENDNDDNLQLGISPSRLLYLGKFTYETDGEPVQTFEVPDHIIKHNKPVRAVIMRVKNNWGLPNYTCLYRFRVHGVPADLA